MLPSMPILNLNSLTSPDDANENLINEAPNKPLNPPEADKPNSSLPISQDVKVLSSPDIKEPDDEIIFVNSSVEKRKLKTGVSQTTVSKKKKKCNQLDEEIPTFILEDTESSFAEAYFLKVMKCVDKDLFDNFVSLLLDYETNKGSRVELFGKVEKLFSNFPELVNEFLGFLPPHEALECQRLKEKLFISEAWNVFKHIEPNQMNKLITILEQHLDNTNMSVGEIKELINSLFKNQPKVALGISSLFMSGPPPVRDDSCYERVSSLNLDGDSYEYEAVSIPMQSVKDCSECTCICHADPEALCAACHITVFNCKIYIKKNKVLRTAKIEFDGFTNSEMVKKLNPEYFARREALEMMASSPSKVSLRGERRDRKSISEAEPKKLDSSEENENKPSFSEKPEVCKELVHKVICEEDKFGYLEFFETTEFSEVECEKQKVHSPKKRKPKQPKPVSEKVKANLILEELKETKILLEENKESKGHLFFVDKREPLLKEFSSDKSKRELSSDDNKGIITLCDIKEEFVYPVSNSIEASTRSEGEKKILSSEIEFKVEFQEGVKPELPQKIEGMDVKISSPLKSSWTREEDKVILEAFRKEIDTEHTFSKISSSLPNRSVQDIQSRFRDLMILLERITGGTLEN